MSYTKTGPFHDNSTPRANAAFFNNVETTLSAINSAATDNNISSNGSGTLNTLSVSINAKQININGSTAGNAVCYQPFTSPNFKVVLIYFNGYRNNGGHTQGIPIPVPFTQRSKIWTGDLGPILVNGKPNPSTIIIPQKNGVTTDIAIMMGQAPEAGNVYNSSNGIGGWSMGEILGGFDTIIIPSGGLATLSGLVLIIGW